MLLIQRSERAEAIRMDLLPSSVFKPRKDKDKVIDEDRPNLPTTSTPAYASFPSERVTISAGSAIFHIASERVVVCYHTRDKYWFLPKGRKNANETLTAAAEREAFEEGGYRNRVLPLPMQHRQPDPDTGHEKFVSEPLWTQLLPLSSRSQYILFWYVTETLPPKEEEEMFQARVNAHNHSSLYCPPPAFPKDLTLDQRIAQDKTTDVNETQILYEPVHHSNTGVDEEELLYESHLLPIAEAIRRLKNSVTEDVVRRGWEAIQLRMQIEREESVTPPG